MASLTPAGETLKTATEAIFPPDDPFRPFLDALPPLAAEIKGVEASLMAAINDLETRFGRDYADRVARAAALGAQQWARALVRAEVRRLLPVLAGTLGLVGLAGVAVGLLIH